MGKHALKEVKYKFRETPGKHAGKRFDEQPGYIKKSGTDKIVTRRVENEELYEHDRDADTN